VWNEKPQRWKPQEWAQNRKTGGEDNLRKTCKVDEEGWVLIPKHLRHLYSKYPPLTEPYVPVPLVFNGEEISGNYYGYRNGYAYLQLPKPWPSTVAVAEGDGKLSIMTNEETGAASLDIASSNTSTTSHSVVVMPVIEGGRISRVVVNGATFELRTLVPMDELPKVVGLFTELASYVDLNDFAKTSKRGSSIGSAGSRLTTWATTELKDFVESGELRKDQFDALQILAKNEELSRASFIDQMRKLTDNPEFDMRTLRALLAGITYKSKSRGHERPFQVEERSIGNNWVQFYRLAKEEYRDMLSGA